MQKAKLKPDPGAGRLLFLPPDQIRPNPEQNMGEDTKFYQLNMIISAREMHDEKTALKLLDNYIRTYYEISK